MECRIATIQRYEMWGRILGKTSADRYRFLKVILRNKLIASYIGATWIQKLHCYFINEIFQSLTTKKSLDILVSATLLLFWVFFDFHPHPPKNAFRLPYSILTPNSCETGLCTCMNKGPIDPCLKILEKLCYIVI